MTDAEPRPHTAARLEAHVRAFVETQHRRRGWLPAVVPHVGYGAAGWVQALARVVLVPPGSPGPAREDGRGSRRFVTVQLGSHSHRVTSAREGYVDARLASHLEPGWHPATPGHLRGLPLHRCVEHRGTAAGVPRQARVPAGAAPAHRLGPSAASDDTRSPEPVSARDGFGLRDELRARGILLGDHAD